ncbi:MAG: TerC/Alx family metal homeostasis membrane protein [bacterium]|nr:TerC/Alx family metal homeostasis membrane protein [bacterium]
MSQELSFFSLFILFVLAVLAFDLGVFSKSNKNVSFKNAMVWTAIWVGFAAVFYVLLKQYGGLLMHGINSQEGLLLTAGKYQPDLKFASSDFASNMAIYNQRVALDFLTGYLIEYSLSVDNLFVILLIFTSFAVPEIYYKKVLFWGVLGAIVLRMMFVFFGAALIDSFSWILYLFGAFLVFTGFKILFTKNVDETMDVEKHPIVRFASKYLALHSEYDGGSFTTKVNGKKFFTPLFIVVLVVEFSDLIFAVDSVPAIFAITKDPYVVFFSNIFAIMGLRSLFFLLNNVMHLFTYLQYGLGVLLAFIGFKMLFEHWFFEIGFTNVHSLIVIFTILAVSIGLSLLFPPKKEV